MKPRSAQIHFPAKPRRRKPWFSEVTMQNETSARPFGQTAESPHCRCSVWAAERKNRASWQTDLLNIKVLLIKTKKPHNIWSSGNRTEWTNNNMQFADKSHIFGEWRRNFPQNKESDWDSSSARCSWSDIIAVGTSGFATLLFQYALLLQLFMARYLFFFAVRNVG